MRQRETDVERPVLFLDAGGVMNDNRRRGPQWQRHVADFLAPRLGGRKRDWRLANAVVAERLYREMRLPAPDAPDDAFRAFHHASLEDWRVAMCRELGLSPPEAEAQRLELAQEASAYVTRRVHAAFPGAIPAIRALRRRDYTLHTASGEFTVDLEGYLEGMGVRACFGTLHGCDLIGAAKSGPGYYERLFRHAGVEPARALVVDDSEQTLDWATTVGTRTVLCGTGASTYGRHGRVAVLAALPAWLRNHAPMRASLAFPKR